MPIHILCISSYLLMRFFYFFSDPLECLELDSFVLCHTPWMDLSPPRALVLGPIFLVTKKN